MKMNYLVHYLLLILFPFCITSPSFADRSKYKQNLHDKRNVLTKNDSNERITNFTTPVLLPRKILSSKKNYNYFIDSSQNKDSFIAKSPPNSFAHLNEFKYEMLNVSIYESQNGGQNHIFIFDKSRITYENETEEFIIFQNWLRDNKFSEQTESPTTKLGVKGGEGILPSMPDINGLQNSIFHLPTPIVPENSSHKISRECMKDVGYINSFLLRSQKTENSKWVLEILDSWGKYEGGFFQGNLQAVGFMEECLAVKVNNSDSNPGRYCLVMYKSQNSSFTRNTLNSKSILGVIPFFSYGTCIPSSCQAEDLEESLDLLLSEEGQELISIYCQSSADENTLDSWNIFGIIIFSLLGLVLLIASFEDIRLKRTNQSHKRKEGWMPYLLAFSVPENFSKIFQLRNPKSPGVISCIHGIRFLSMTWVVFGHQYAFSFVSASNVPIEATQKFFFQIISNADKSVDSFFVISGLVLAYQYFKDVNSSKPSSFPWIQYYLYRFLRLAPPIAGMVLFMATILGLLARGPSAPYYKDSTVDSCRTYWWMDWTFFSNFIYRYSAEDLEQKYGEVTMCLAQCWYTSVDTQIYMFMPLILLPLLNWRRIGQYMLLFWILLTFVVRGLIIGLEDPHLDPNMFAGMWDEGFKKLYVMPYARATPYLIGFGTGYFLANLKGKKIMLKRYQIIGGWLTATVLGLWVMFALYPYNQINLTNPPPQMPDGYLIFYHTFQRGIWGVCLCWVVFACYTGYGGAVNSFLSYPPFQPLSRLTYCFYLVSLPLQVFFQYTKIRPDYITNLSQVMDTCGVLFISGIGALLLSLAVESPVINIMKICFAPAKPREPAVNGREMIEEHSSPKKDDGIVIQQQVPDK